MGRSKLEGLVEIPIDGLDDMKVWDALVNRVLVCTICTYGPALPA